MPHVQITIAGLQAGATSDVEVNLARLERAAREAVGRGADLLITPEMFVSGYNQPREVIHGNAQQQLVGRVARIAQDAGIAVLAGLPIPTPEGVTNTAVLVDSDGSERVRYAKSHLFGDLDRDLFVAGNAASPVVDFRGVRIAPMICYDVEFPEPVRRACLAGADAVLVPTAQMEPFAYTADQLVRARAWENQVYVAYVNRCDVERDLRYVGRSSIVAPSAEVLDALGPDTEGLVVATIDSDVVRAARAQNPYLTDLRTDLH